MKLYVVNSLLSENLVLYDKAISGIKQCLPAYEEKCSKKILEIANCSSVKHADHIFDELLEIQAMLSNLLFGRQIDIGEKLETLTREFDRLDDPYIREYWFKRFSAGVIWPTPPDSPHT